MFVSKARHRKLELQLIDAVAKLQVYQTAHSELLGQWNALVTRINEHGGEALFEQAANSATNLTKDDFRKLLQLVHPDRHEGKPIAIEMTQKLLELRNCKN